MEVNRIINVINTYILYNNFVETGMKQSYNKNVNTMRIEKYLYLHKF